MDDALAPKTTADTTARRLDQREGRLGGAAGLRGRDFFIGRWRRRLSEKLA
jgi:hypothetical protein